MANAEIIPLDVDACDQLGNPLVLHFALRALKQIRADDEVRVQPRASAFDFPAACLGLMVQGFRLQVLRSLYSV